MNQFIIKISRANVACRFGRYVRIAVMEVEQGTSPKMISPRAKGVVRVVRIWDRRHDGGNRSASARALREAEELLQSLRANQ